jgi:hypothetical protein
MKKRKSRSENFIEQGLNSWDKAWKMKFSDVSNAAMKLLFVSGAFCAYILRRIK